MAGCWAGAGMEAIRGRQRLVDGRQILILKCVTFGSCLELQLEVLLVVTSIRLTSSSLASRMCSSSSAAASARENVTGVVGWRRGA